jgi:hypothetical protein
LKKIGTQELEFLINHATINQIHDPYGFRLYCIKVATLADWVHYYISDFGYHFAVIATSEVCTDDAILRGFIAEGYAWPAHGYYAP